MCGQCGKPMWGLWGNGRNSLAPGYICSQYRRWGKRAPSGCGHFFVEHDLLESLVLDYLTQAAPQVKQLLDAATATNLDEARPLLDAIHDAKVGRNGVWLDMLGFVDTQFQGNKARRKTRMSVQELYGLLYERAKPELEKKVADKEAEIEAVLDGFAGLTSKMKDRVNIRLEALQAELDALRADLRDSRLSWEYFTDQLTARKEALDRATATLNQEGQVRQKGRSPQDGGGQDRLSLPPRRQACYPGLHRGDPCGGRGRSAAHLSRSLSPKGFVSSPFAIYSRKDEAMLEFRAAGTWVPTSWRAAFVNRIGNVAHFSFVPARVASMSGFALPLDERAASIGPTISGSSRCRHTRRPRRRSIGGWRGVGWQPVGQPPDAVRGLWGLPLAARRWRNFAPATCADCAGGPRRMPRSARPPLPAPGPSARGRWAGPGPRGPPAGSPASRRPHSRRAKTLLLVQTQRIVDLGADAGLREPFAQFVAEPIRYADHILIPDVPPPRTGRGQHQRRAPARPRRKRSV